MANKTFDFELSGVNELVSAFARIGHVAVQAAARSLYESAERVMTESKTEYVPVDTGALRSSGNVQVVKSDGPIEVVLGYGGPAAGYAVFVHEMNKNYRGGRQFKYLETPLKAAVPSINQKLKDDIGAAVGGAL